MLVREFAGSGECGSAAPRPMGEDKFEPEDGGSMFMTWFIASVKFMDSLFVPLVKKNEKFIGVSSCQYLNSC